MFTGARYLKRHMNGGRKRKPKYKKQSELHGTVPKCSMKGTELGYKLECEYLGMMLQGDGGCDKNVTQRLALARVEYNELMWLWHGCKVTMDSKMRIYNSNVLFGVVWCGVRRVGS